MSYELRARMKALAKEIKLVVIIINAYLITHT